MIFPDEREGAKVFLPQKPACAKSGACEPPQRDRGAEGVSAEDVMGQSQALGELGRWEQITTWEEDALTFRGE